MVINLYSIRAMNDTGMIVAILGSIAMELDWVKLYIVSIARVGYRTIQKFTRMRKWNKFLSTRFESRTPSTPPMEKATISPGCEAAG
jgi:hypothetical protein